MNMSMDKPLALNRAEGTRGPQVENAKINEKRCSQGMGDMSMDKPLALNRAEGTTGP